MKHRYEFIEHHEQMPFALFINSIDHIPFHWHKEIELIYVLKGSVDLFLDKRRFILGEEDWVVVNSMDVHKLDRTEKENVLLTLQFDPGIVQGLGGPEKRRIDCHSAESGQNGVELSEPVRAYLAQMTWELNKRNDGYQDKVLGFLHLLTGHLVRYYSSPDSRDEGSGTSDVDLERLRRIMQYVDENYMNKIHLNQMAEQEHLSFYYFSHFFKSKIGISFQKYLTLVRLEKAEIELRETQKNMIDIAADCGFANVKLFNKNFKEKMGVTPSEYRQKHQKSTASSPGKHLPFTKDTTEYGSYIQVDTVKVLDGLYRHLPRTEHVSELRSSSRSAEKKIAIRADEEGEQFEHHWNCLLTAGRAAEGLREQWRRQLADIQSEQRFQYIRFHGIFNDEMMVYDENDDGEPEYNWNYVDELYDFLLSVQIRPFVELGFMPGKLRRSDETIFWWKGNISPPKDMGKWRHLVSSFVRHCINRYGLAEVKRWYFEVWNEPDAYEICWAGTKEEYFEFYAATVDAIKEISPDLRVGGPALNYITVWETEWMQEFLRYNADHGVRIDFFSFHSYSEYWPGGEKGKGLSNTQPPGFFVDTIHKVRERIADSPFPHLELHLTEWNFSLYPGNLLHDTMFMAPFVVKNAIDSIRLLKSLGFWTFTDIFEETGAGRSPFHGGFGLINMHGLKKPSYYAFAMLNKLGRRLIGRGSNYVVTREGENIQILVCNYVHVDALFASGEWSAISEKNRYGVFENGEPLELELELDGLCGDYKITFQVLSREQGSVFDAWLEMGAPEFLEPEEVDYLQKRSGPALRTEMLRQASSHTIRITVPPHGVQLITLNKRY
ncbi:helix-turn-helix domain-containing protein [Paenibacillus sp. VCA1]|uniref:GH39 family glycosyl hydrolase n=1 Tax=Paenibacillus sp. VCA1 TaxID=3039148 RepID=UPI002870EF8C|nr:helix-turn-helix domain-containing protein [Paenibacillus sp. VCA1]MDR9853474.1 helix-turn-helix domain-containing protein [Paenibacillus sp. VCA1]